MIVYTTHTDTKHACPGYDSKMVVYFFCKITVILLWYVGINRNTAHESSYVILNNCCVVHACIRKTVLM